MARRIQCDSCGKTTEDMSLKLLSLQNAPMGNSGYGSDGWSNINVMIMRKITQEEYDRRQYGGMQQNYPVNQRVRPLVPEDNHVTPLYTSLDLCPDCTKRVVAATGCPDKIAQELPPVEEGTPETEVLPEPEPPREDGKSVWEHIREEAHQ